MQCYPAIDLSGGRCVRLVRGDFAAEIRYDADPVAQARAFADAGVPLVHVVDLDAARTGSPANRPVIAEIVRALATPVQTGGGIRDEAAAAALLAEVGVARVVLGTAALEDPDWARSLAARHPGRVAVGLDVRGREVAVRGWQTSVGRSIGEVMASLDDAGFAAVIATQISRDGVGTGPDLDLYRELLETTETDVVASGGVGCADHLRELAHLEAGGRVLAGVIVGRALYEGALDIDDALAAAGAD